MRNVVVSMQWRVSLRCFYVMKFQATVSRVNSARSKNNSEKNDSPELQPQRPIDQDNL